VEGGRDIEMTIGKIINVGENNDTIVVLDSCELEKFLRGYSISISDILAIAAFNTFDCQSGIPEWLEFFMQMKDSEGMSFDQWMSEKDPRLLKNILGKTDGPDDGPDEDWPGNPLTDDLDVGRKF